MQFFFVKRREHSFASRPFFAQIKIGTITRSVRQKLLNRHAFGGFVLDLGKEFADRVVQAQFALLDENHHRHRRADPRTDPAVREIVDLSGRKEEAAAKEEPPKEEPPKDHWIRKIWEIWEKTQQEPDDAKRDATFMEIIKLHRNAPVASFSASSIV